MRAALVNDVPMLNCVVLQPHEITSFIVCPVLDFFSVAVHQVLWYVSRSIIGLISRVMFTSSICVAYIRSINILAYYAFEDILIE